jgi:hypothetical protein
MLERNEMDVYVIAGDIEQWLDDEGLQYEAMRDTEQAGAFFVVQFNDGLSGFISVEDNEDDLEFGTVTVAIWLAEVGEAPPEALKRLLVDNGSMYNAALVVVPMSEGEQDLFLQTRIAIEHFETDDIPSHVNNLVAQAQMFLDWMWTEGEEPVVETGA